MRNRKAKKKVSWHSVTSQMAPNRGFPISTPPLEQPFKRRGPANRPVIKDMYSIHIRGFCAGGLAVDSVDWNLRAEPSDGQRGRQRLNHDEDAKRHPEPKPKRLAEQEATHAESSE